MFGSGILGLFCCDFEFCGLMFVVCFLFSLLLALLVITRQVVGLLVCIWCFECWYVLSV